MQKWEYTELDVKWSNVNTVKTAYLDDKVVLSQTNVSNLRAYLNKLGQEGWEMVHVNFASWESFYYFKRPLE